MLMTADDLTHWNKQVVMELELRRAAYQLLVDFISEEPTLDNLVAWRNHSAWEYLKEQSEGARKVYQALQEVPVSNLYNLSVSMREAYKELFKKGSTLPVQPCESMYRANEQKVPKSYEPEVRQAYADFSLYFKKMNGESDDHIAVELEFMAVIIEKMLNTVMTEERYQRYMYGQSRFIHDHLERWAVNFGEDLERCSKHPVYAALGSMLKEFVAKEAKWAQAIAV